MNSSILQILRDGFRASLVGIALLLTQVNYSSAQKGKFHVGATVGYGFPLASQNIPKGWSDQFIGIGLGPGLGQTFYYSKAQHGSYGAGVAINAFGGYSITDNINTEFGISYIFGRQYTLTIQNTSPQSSSYRTGGRMLRLIPSVRYHFNKGRFSPFMQIGLVIGAVNRLNFEEEWVQANQGVIYYQSTTVYRYTGGVSWGVSFSMGTEFRFTKRLSISAALTAIGQSYSPLRGKKVKYTVNGEDRLPGLSTNFKEFRFVSSKGSSISDSTKPTELPKLWYPFSSIRPSIGIVYSFIFKKK